MSPYRSVYYPLALGRLFQYPTVELQEQAVVVVFDPSVCPAWVAREGHPAWSRADSLAVVEIDRRNSNLTPIHRLACRLPALPTAWVSVRALGSAEDGYQ
jgi:hypothetical protein